MVMAWIVCRGRQGVYTFTKLGVIVLGICGLSFGPFIMAGQLTQVWPVMQPRQTSADSTAQHSFVLVQACIRPVALHQTAPLSQGAQKRIASQLSVTALFSEHSKTRGDVELHHVTCNTPSKRCSMDA